MLDHADEKRFTDLARAGLAAGATHDDLIATLRREGVDNKVDCIKILYLATGMPIGDAKRLVHFSPAWADRRESDERLEEQFWRAMFIWCILDGGEVTEPPDEAADCRDRQQRATAQLREIAAALPVEAVPGLLDRGRLGDAFVALVAASRARDLPPEHWRNLAAAAGTLRLTELLDTDPPPEDPTDPVYAAHVVFSRSGEPG